MSHFTRVRTKLRDIESVRRALHDLGYTTRAGVVKGYLEGEKTEAEVVVEVEDGRDVGFRYEDGEVVLVGDFWRREVSGQGFMEKVTQQVAYNTIIDKATAQGFTVTVDEQQEDGSRRIIVQRW
jgi:hypothetical protein